MQDINALTRSIFDAYNRRDFDKIVSLSSDQLESIDLPTGKKFSGRDGLKQWCELWSKSFSDSKVEVVNHFVSGEFVCTEYFGRGKQTGPLTIGGLTLPASNRSVDFRLCNVTQIRDGKVIGGRAYYDLVTMLRQLGVEPSRLAA